MIREREVSALSGGFMLLVLIVVLGLSVYGLAVTISQGFAIGILGSVVVMVASIISLIGLTVVNPNESQVVQLFGNYIGTLKRPGGLLTTIIASSS